MFSTAHAGWKPETIWAVLDMLLGTCLDLKIPSRMVPQFSIWRLAFLCPHGSHKNSSFNHKCRANDWSDSPLSVPWSRDLKKYHIPYHHPYFFSTKSWSHIVPPCLVIKWLLNSPAMFHGDFLDLDLCSRCLVVDDHKVAVQLQTIVFTGSRGTKCCTAQPWWWWSQQKG